MFDFFKSKSKNPSQKELSANDRMWMDMYSTTMSDMQGYIGSSTELFTLLASAVFALHQDIMKKFAIDLRRTDDMVLAAALDKMQPHPLGSWPERAMMAMKSLHQIDTLNLQTLAKEAETLSKEDKTKMFLTLMLKMRSLAARIWLMTMYERIDPKFLKLGVITIWSMLSVVEFKALEEDAKLFSGSFFEGVKCENFNSAHWPHMPTPRPSV